MINEKYNNYNGSFNYTNDVFSEIMQLLKKLLKMNAQPELHFQEVEQKTYGFSTDNLSEIWQKFIGMLKEGWEMIKEFIVKADSTVKRWLYSDSVLDRVINNISEEIFLSSTKFGAKIESIELKEAYKDHSYEEIEIDIKVPKEMDINKLNDFWDYVGTNVSKSIDNELFTDSEKEMEIREKLLVVVSQ